MTTEPTELREKIARALEAEGLHPNPDQYDSSIHGWRCENPDMYGPCTCFQECVDAVQAIVREAQAEVLRDAAQAIEDSDKALPDLAIATAVRSLRFRADDLTEGDR
ncbi:hypothetical protein I8D64_03180 [Brachybacterium sp. MASK1Z-5]|uniref:Uncharacterized protein n=1 Tax=Brachybacterium halotolerans TaxID=2795215 RepID=A0ABS1B6Z1_9MICO|nr:hypothetical protein [Brachybacterium halotolerans]MBK0330401.1 hypothetical protein [Brachybacterium halotolerans]